MSYWFAECEEHSKPEYIDMLYRRLGYTRTPYHYVITREGWTAKGRPESWPGGVDEPGVANALCVGIVLLKPAYKANAEQLAQINAFLGFLLRKHGLPNEAVVYRTSRLTGHNWQKPIDDEKGTDP